METKEKIKYATIYLKTMQKLKAIPSELDLEKAGVPRSKYRRGFETKEKLAQFVEKEKSLSKAYKKCMAMIKKEGDAKEKVKRAILSKYVGFSSKQGFHPTFQELKEIGVEKNAIKNYFDSLAGLQQEAERLFKEEMAVVYSEEDLLSADRIEQTEENIQKYDRHVYSSIGTGETDKDYLHSIYVYLALNKARLFLLVTEMDFARIDPYLKEEYMAGRLDIVFQDTRVTTHLSINTVMINEKVVDPTAGIGRQSVQNSRSANFPSFIYPSPKQTLKSIPDKYGKFPRLQMSPGAITKPNYIKSRFKRTKRKLMAENDHLIGAIIVERDGDNFYARQTQRGDKGSFIDWGVEYRKDGRTLILPPEAFVMGDLHSKKKCKTTFDLWIELIRMWNTKTIVHDIYDSASGNPHEMNKPISAMVGMLEGDTSTPDEVAVLVKDLNRIRSVSRETYVTESNHDDMMARSFDNLSIWKVPQNAFLGSLLMPMAVLHQMRDEHTEEQISNLIQEKVGISKEVLYRMFPNLCKPYSLLQFACELYGLKSGKDLIWGRLESSYKIGGFELAEHGSRGSNGAKPSQATYRRSFTKFIHGHTHTESQMNFIVSVGHTTGSARYAKGGLSSWTKGSAIVYSTGQFQMIRSVNGQVRSFKDAFIPEEFRLATKRIQKLTSNKKSSLAA